MAPGAAVVGDCSVSEFMRPVVLRRHHQPGGILVEPVHDAGAPDAADPDRLVPQWRSAR